MEIPPQIAQQLFGYQKPVNDIYQESPGKSTRSKADNGWLNSMMNENPYLRPMRVGNSGMGGMNRGPQSMGMGGGYLNDVYNLMAKSGGNFGLGGQMDMTNGGVLPGFMNTANVQPNSRMMGGGGMGMGLGMGMSNGLLGPGPSTPGVDVNSPQAKAGQQAMLSYLQSRFTPDQLSRMMMQGGGGMGMGLGMGMNSPQISTQQAAELYFRNMFGGGMGSRNNQSNSGNYYNLVNPIELLGLGGMR